MTGIENIVGVGSMCISAQAGAEFKFQLLWAFVAAGLTLSMLPEMSGWLAGLNRRALAAERERFGVAFEGPGTRPASVPSGPPPGI